MQKRQIAKRTRANLQLDPLDRKILYSLITDGRASFLDLAKEFKVANATIHMRYRKLIENGVIEGIHAKVNLRSLGFLLTAFVGIEVMQAGQHEDVVSVIKRLPEVIEVHYTTGRYALLAKIVARDMDDLYLFLTKKIQSIAKVSSTETFMVLNSFVDREFDAVKLTKERTH